MDLLPDCRTQRVPAGINRGLLGTWLPVFCANCGADGGLVPEECTTFLFYLCNTCAQTWGQVAGTMLMPDEVFFARLQAAQLDEYGHYLSDRECARVEASSPLVKLIQEHARGG